MSSTTHRLTSEMKHEHTGHQVDEKIRRSRSSKEKAEYGEVDAPHQKRVDDPPEKAQRRRRVPRFQVAQAKCDCELTASPKFTEVLEEPPGAASGPGDGRGGGHHRKFS